MNPRKILFNLLKSTVMGKVKNNMSDDANSIIKTHVVLSMGASFIPLLLADIFAVMALQLDMIRQLCRVYGVDYSETRGKAIVTSLTSSTIARLGARSFIKLIPGIGSLLGGVAVSVFAGASTYALGEVFKMHFENGGTILDFDVERLTRVYKEKFEKGKDYAKNVQNEEEEKAEDIKVEDVKVEDVTDAAGAIIDDAQVASSAAASSSKPVDVISKLKELGELKSTGIISEEEFEAMKRKLIDSF